MAAACPRGPWEPAGESGRESLRSMGGKGTRRRVASLLLSLVSSVPACPLHELYNLSHTETEEPTHAKVEKEQFDFAPGRWKPALPASAGNGSKGSAAIWW